jgi:sterol desaturase/sphingolipid hydroxylase (fatty acid hydroxylase superfamily)
MPLILRRKRKMQFVGSVARWSVWPVYMFAFMFAYAHSQKLGYDPGFSVLAITVVHIAAIALTELALPARPDWRWLDDRQVFNDIVHSLLLDVGARLGTAVLTLALAVGAAMLSRDSGIMLWPHAWPLWAQIVLAVLIYDFCDYWKHRAYHAWRWFWPIHALHHNPPRMHVFKAGRLHFLEAAIRALVSSAPLVALGAPGAVFFWLAALSNAFGGQNHWNVDARLPRWLHLSLATPHVHWAHHDKQFVERSVNLSPFTMLFDHLLGTYRDPIRDPVGQVGIVEDPISPGLPGQLVAPLAFVLARHPVP